MTQAAILVVDDEPDLRVLMERILGRRGYAVTTAGGVVEALAELATMPAQPDLLITDINMPDGRGMDLADEVCRRAGPITVLYVSGYSREQAEAEGMIPAGGTLLEKPFNPVQLAEATAVALGKQPSRPAPPGPQPAEPSRRTAFPTG